VFVDRAAGAAAHLVQAFRQTLSLMHFKVQQYRPRIGRFAIDQLVARRVSAFGGAILNEAAGGNMRRGLADVCAYADAINRHGSKLSTAKKLILPEVTISIWDCEGDRRSGYGGRLAFVIDADFELQIRKQLQQMLGDSGFDARRDIAGIVIN
jgi:hypothetical protein